MSHEALSILDFIRPRGGPIVVKLDRLRNTGDVLNLVHELEEKGASLRVLEPAIDTGGPMGRVVLTVLGMLAEMELGIRNGNAPTSRPRSRRGSKGRPATFDRARIVTLLSPEPPLPICDAWRHPAAAR
jgi:DNA invertase Pin-like site-specific DNA recombinase